MKQKRDQRNAEKLDALIGVLKEQGVIPEEWADSIDNINDHGQGREAREAAREGRGPPSWAGGGNGNSGGDNPGNGNGGGGN
jgi:hypothetical protein